MHTKYSVGCGVDVVCEKLRASSKSECWSHFLESSVMMWSRILGMLFLELGVAQFRRRDLARGDLVLVRCGRVGLTTCRRVRAGSRLHGYTDDGLRKGRAG